MQSDSAKPLYESIPKSILGAKARAGARRFARHVRRKRDKVFDYGRGILLNHTQKRALIDLVASTAAEHRRQRLTGGLTHTHVHIFRVMLYVIYNHEDARCFPSYEYIVEKTGSSRSTVERAINALEAAGFITWDWGLCRKRITELSELLGCMIERIAVRRASNRYRFIPSEKPKKPTEVRNEAGTTKPFPNHRENFAKTEEITPCELSLADFRKLFEARLARAGPK